MSALLQPSPQPCVLIALMNLLPAALHGARLLAGMPRRTAWNARRQLGGYFLFLFLNVFLVPPSPARRHGRPVPR